MILRDINYYLNIFAGQCVSLKNENININKIETKKSISIFKEHSWRHKEFKKYSKKLGNHLYCNSLLASFSHDQYMSAVRALQSVFCQNHNKVRNRFSMEIFCL